MGENTLKALIIVDIQNDFIPGGSLAVKQGDQVVHVANLLMPGFELVVATQDFHPADHLSFASQHPGKNVGEIVNLDGLEQVLWPDHCVAKTRGAEFVTELDADRIDRVFQKGTHRPIDSYSGFFDNDHRQATGLGEFLKENAVSDVYVLGLATDYCVKFTALDAVGLGFTTYLVLDGCRGVELNSGDVDRAVDDLQRAGVEIVDSDSVLRQLSSRPPNEGTD
jgi:nicotinamidase/pyrazinamidase